MTDVDHQPDRAYFDVMAAHARTHWWYEARRALVQGALAGTPGDGVLLDVGCGTGDNLAALRASWSGPVLATDLSAYALAHAGSGVAVARAERLPFATAGAAAVTSMDVVEHLDDDVVGLREYARVLQPGGVLLLTVPAYQSLWSDHDVRAAHRRRYTRRRLERAVRAAGFDVERSTYFNSFLVPPAFALRRTPLRRVVRDNDEEVGASSPLVSRVMTALGAAERRWALRRRVPFGLSILLVARRR
jgi:ubiquinone/menaquinone biosynthesis C-methylase UbiE